MTQKQRLLSIMVGLAGVALVVTALVRLHETEVQVRVAFVCNAAEECIDLYAKPRGKFVIDAIAWWGLLGANPNVPHCKDGCTIRTLYDQSGHGNDLTQADPKKRTKFPP